MKSDNMFCVLFFLMIISTSIPIFGIILEGIPISETNQSYILTVKEQLDADKLNITHKLNVSGGLVQTTSQTVSFFAMEGNNSIFKNIKYDGDIRYIPSNMNMISYNLQKNMFGETISIKDCVITYDENTFEK